MEIGRFPRDVSDLPTSSGRVGYRRMEFVFASGDEN